MNERSTIFLSSSWEDLKDHRECVLQALFQLKRQVDCMEYFGARSGAPLGECLERVRNADIYIGIIGTRYGSIAKDGKSYTQLEYEEAILHKKRILIYVIDEDEHPVLLKYVDRGDDAQRLREFRQAVLSEHICKKFLSPDDLARIISIDLINLFEEMGKNIRAAIQRNDIPQLLIDAGFLFSKSQVSLDIANHLNKAGEGVFRVSDRELESIMAAGFLAQNIRNNRFDILSHFVTFRHEVWELLIYFLKRGGIDQKALSNAITWCDDSLHLRLLISIAGRLEADECVNAICKKLFDHIQHNRIIEEYRIPATPFNTVIREALGSMSLSTESIIKEYVNKARAHKKWQAKQVLEHALKKQKKKCEEILL